ncbi:hypothetical protein [Kitasatospora sp. NPDC098663]|uniref:hypothetical protein n=1 Tax=Kitasatospora sp. NPDC098663 TaxID=3364096 RepID=UPI0037F67EEF
MATIFDEMLGMGDPDDWARMRDLNRRCDWCMCCLAVQCVGEDGESCGTEVCPCTSE